MITNIRIGLGLFSLLCAMLVTGCAMTAPVETPHVAQEPAYHVTLTAHGDGGAVADYRFDRAAPVWFFPRSNPDIEGNPWRQKSWSVETPGIALVRIGSFDALVRTDGAPLASARIRMEAPTVPLRADYAPVLRFSDNGRAFFSGHLQLLTADSKQVVAALPSDLNEADVADTAGTLTVVAPNQRMIVDGEALRDRASMSLDDGNGRYVYVGNSRAIETPAFLAVVDPGLPQWLSREIYEFPPRVMALYRQRLGTPAGDRPMALVAWGGGEKSGISFSGSVLEDMLVLQMSGEQALEPTDRVRAVTRNFFAHEGAHFWLGNTVHYALRSESWMTEGGADLLAARATAALVPTFDVTARLNQLYGQCLETNLPGQALADAEARGDHDASYGCGAMLYLVAEAASARRSPGSDLFDFVGGLIAAHRAQGEMGSSDWFAAFAEASGDRTLTEMLRNYVAEGAGDPEAFWETAFTRAGVPHDRGEDGHVTLR